MVVMASSDGLADCLVVGLMLVSGKYKVGKSGKYLLLKGKM